MTLLSCRCSDCITWCNCISRAISGFNPGHVCVFLWVKIGENWWKLAKRWFVSWCRPGSKSQQPPCSWNVFFPASQPSQASPYLSGRATLYTSLLLKFYTWKKSEKFHSHNPERERLVFYLILFYLYSTVFYPVHYVVLCCVLELRYSILTMMIDALNCKVKSIL